MESSKPQRHYILSAPRTASNLFTQILNLDKQPSTGGPGQRVGYFFMGLFMKFSVELNLARKPISEWSEEERSEIKKSYEECSAEFLKYIENMEAQGKNVVVKEHATFLVEPVTDNKRRFGNDVTSEDPWRVSNVPGKTFTPGNITPFPDEFLRTWKPTFLIRHPALMFPSHYRAIVDIQKKRGDDLKEKHESNGLDITLRYSRMLYDWFAAQRDEGSGAAAISDDSSRDFPIVIDADDVILHPEFLRDYSKKIGLDPEMLKFEWSSVPQAEAQAKGWDPLHLRMASTLHASEKILKNKAARGIDLNEEIKKWKTEFGEHAAWEIEWRVRDTLPDYEYLRARRLKPKEV